MIFFYCSICCQDRRLRKESDIIFLEVMNLDKSETMIYHVYLGNIEGLYKSFNKLC